MYTAKLAASMLALLASVLGAASARAETVKCTAITTLPAVVTVAGVYCLTGNLATAMTSGNAIEIQTNNVVLDLNGFKLTGLAAGPGTSANGIYANSRENITIRNGTILGFSNGILATNVRTLVEDIRADQNTSVGIHVEGGGHTIRNNQVVATGGGGGSAASVYGILVVGSNTQVINNDVINTVGQGGGTAWGILIGGHATNGRNMVTNNRITTADVGIEFSSNTGKYRDNLTFGVTTPFVPGGAVDAGNNN